MALLQTKITGERSLQPLEVDEIPMPLKRYSEPVKMTEPVRTTRVNTDNTVTTSKPVDIVDTVKKTTWPQLNEPVKMTKPTIKANLPKVSNDLKEAINKGLQSDNPIIRQKAESVLKEKIKEETKDPTKTKVLQASTKFDFKKGAIIAAVLIVLFVVLPKIVK